MLQVTNVLEINPIWADKVTILKEDDLDDVVELPLLNACKELYKKNIRTIMSSCNKYNILGYEEYQRSDNYNITSRMRESFGYGEGYAYIMLDYDSLDEENKAIINVMHDANNDLFLYNVTDYIKYAGSDNEFKKRCPNVKEREQHYGYRTVTMRYPLTKETSILEVKEYYASIINKFKQQEKGIKTENETRYLLLELAKKYEKALNANDIFVTDDLFKDASLIETTTPLEEKYGISSDSDLLRFLFVIAVLDINHLLKEPYELMVLRFEPGYIHLLFNGEEYSIVGNKEVQKGQVIRFGNSAEKAKLVEELNLLEIYKEVDNKIYLLDYLKNVNASLKNM